MSAATVLAYVIGPAVAVVGLAAIVLVVWYGVVATRREDDEDEDLAVARAAGVVPGEQFDGMTWEERAAEVAWLVELFDASPDVGASDCPIIPGRGGEGGSNP